MKSNLGHVQINVSASNLLFYKDLMAFLGWNTLYEDDSMVGVGASDGASLWFAASANDATNDYDGPGVNHLGIAAESQADVDSTVQ